MPESEHEEYEIIPVSPLRRMEKRIEELEVKKAPFSSEEFLKEVIDIIKMNQSLIDEMARGSDALKLEISKLPARIDALLSSMGELITYIKAATTEEVIAPSASMEPLVSKLNELVEGNKKIVELNQTMVMALEELEKKMRRTQQPLPPIRRPPIPMPLTLQRP